MAVAGDGGDREDDGGGASNRSSGRVVRVLKVTTVTKKRSG